MKNKFWIPIVFAILMWVIFILQVILKLDLSGLGIHPRDTSSLIGIITAPLIHGNWEHLLSNTLPLIILGLLLFFSYPKIALKIWILNYCITDVLVWIFARTNAYHIGASGIIYGLASFLLCSGFIRMNISAIAIASGVALFYGGMVWGILPIQPNVSWESHLIGGITGAILAVIFRKNKMDKTEQNDILWEDKRKTFNDFINQ